MWADWAIRVEDGRSAWLYQAEGDGWRELAEFLGTFGDALVNTRSTTWRGLTEEDRKGAPVDLLVAHPALMKRPVIRTDDGTLYLGWGKDVQATLV